MVIPCLAFMLACTLGVKLAESYVKQRPLLIKMFRPNESELTEILWLPSDRQRKLVILHDFAKPALEVHSTRSPPDENNAVPSQSLRHPTKPSMVMLLTSNHQTPAFLHPSQRMSFRVTSWLPAM